MARQRNDLRSTFFVQILIEGRIAKGLMVSEATVYRYQRELKEQGKLEW